MSSIDIKGVRTKSSVFFNCVLRKEKEQKQQKNK